MITTKVLSGVNFFEGLDRNELEQLAKICHRVEFFKGDKIFIRGNKAEHFYIITKGKVHLCFQVSILSVDKEIVVDIKQAGDVLAWSALIEPYMLTLSAYCDENCELIRIHGKDLLSLCQEENHTGFILMRNLGKVVGNRLVQMQFICEKEIELNMPSFDGTRRRNY